MSARPPPPTRIPSATRTRSKPRLGISTSGSHPSGDTKFLRQQHRRSSVSGQRTTKTSQKLVVLPSAPQTRPLPQELDDDPTFGGYETDRGVREHKNAAEKMTKEQRGRAGLKRITVYCVAEGLKMRALIPFLRREHNVMPRVYDEALYVMYHLPLLPGYAHSNFRSSAPAKGGKSVTDRLDAAEEVGYQGSYFSVQSPSVDGYTSSSSPVTPFSPNQTTPISSSLDNDTPHTTETEVDRPRALEKAPLPSPPVVEQEVAEVVFFEYGVVVFFGLTEGEEKGILEDLESAGVRIRRIPEKDWEIEDFHYAHDNTIAYPRIYNDFFTLKSRSHLLKISIAHALAQSTLLARYESISSQVLSSPQAISIPQQLAQTGALQLKRHEALKLTGRLFKLRRDVNLVGNVLDVPELFWSEASLKELYDAVREYLEIGPRVQVLNDKIAVASGFLDAIHDHLNTNAMERITRIIIWLILAAILVELGEIVARLIVHASTVSRGGS